MQLVNQTFFILGLPRFDGAYESTNYTIAKMLAVNNTVYYIDNPFTYKDCIKEKNTPQYLTRKPFFKSNSIGILSTAITNLKVVITQPVPSLNFLPEGKLYRLLLSYAEHLIRKRIKRILKETNCTEYIYINSFNFHYPNVCMGLQPLLQIYYCVDPIIRDYDKKHGITSQQYILKHADIVICTSKQLYTENLAINPNTYFVANAANISHSQKALNKNLPILASLANIPKPIIGYFGNIERRIDYNILHQVILTNTDKSFVFVGPQEKEYIPSWFYILPNIYTTGSLPYEQMPNAIKAFDVCILPFKKDEVSRTIFPLKLFEYLGAGKPVVAIDFNEDLKDFTANTVHYCTDTASFNTAINKALQENSNEEIADRIAIAAANTWENRIMEIEKIIVQYLEKK